MNKNLYEKLSLDSIGIDCFFQSITTSINYLNLGYLALSYTTYSMFYDPNEFMHLEIERLPEDYLSDNNKLIFKNRPITWLKKIYHEYFYKNNCINWQNYIIDKDITQINDTIWENIKTVFLDNDLPVIVEIQAEKLRNEYSNIGANVALGEMSPHMLNLIDINKEDCVIVDTFFKAKGIIPTEAFVNALSFNGSYKFKFINPEIKEYEIELLKLLKKNLKESISQYIIIDKKKYTNNIISINNIINDLPEIILYFQDKYDIYANQFLSLSFMPQRHLIRSCAILYNQLYNKYKIEGLDQIEYFSKKSADLWFVFDSIFDKCYLKKEKPFYKIRSLTMLLEAILENDKNIMELMNKLYDRL